MQSDIEIAISKEIARLEKLLAELEAQKATLKAELKKNRKILKLANGKETS